jgi:single-stranded-DNA-specific exonuclease
VHLRDVLDLVDKRAPGLLLRFGGHAMAAGLTLRADRLDEFASLLEQAVDEFADPACFAAALATDGPLAPDEIDLPLVDAIEAEVWGQGFAPPLFCDQFVVARQSIVAGRHLKVELRAAAGARFDAIAFVEPEQLPEIAELLAARGFSGGEVQGILGGNFLRVARRVWK